MKISSGILSLLCIILYFSCTPAPEQEVKDITREFVDALYNLDYGKAQEHCNSQSTAIINFLASNVSQKHISMIEEAGKAEVNILKVSINKDGTTATVLCKITNFLKLGLLDSKPYIEEQTEKRIDLVKENGKWLVNLQM